jgi:hypothetical protein
MEQSMRRKGTSGLGLARIRAEAEMTLSLSSEGDRLYILAETHVGSPRNLPAQEIPS